MERAETPAHGESRRSTQIFFLWPPRQHPTLQLRNMRDELPDEQKAKP